MNDLKKGKTNEMVKKLKCNQVNELKTEKVEYDKFTLHKNKTFSNFHWTWQMSTDCAAFIG